MAKKSKFSERYSEPTVVSNDEGDTHLVIDGSFPMEEVLRLFNDYMGEGEPTIEPDDIFEGYARFGFSEYEARSCWVFGVPDGRGAKPYWGYILQE